MLRFMKNFTLAITLVVSVLVTACGQDNGGQAFAEPVVHEGPVLLYNGTGAAPEDAAAIADILADHGVEYETATAAELNKMSLDELLKYGTIVWPGGLAGKASNALDGATRSRVREAVTAHGVSYVGFCAGSFMAINSPPGESGHPPYGFSLVANDGLLPEYEPDGIHQHDVPETEAITLPGGKVQDMVWYGGPYFPMANEVLARYRDGTPAMMQTVAGVGFVVLSGPHPESPSTWVSDDDRDGVAVDREVAWQLINAAITRQRLPTM